jgi:drug/metabolite transporter (DMT)-like permease
MTTRRSDLLSLAIALVAASTSAILIRLCASAPAVIAYGRLLGAGAVFVIWATVRGVLRLERRDWIVAAISAVFLALHFYFWIASLFMTTINSSVMLLAAQPLFALVLQPLVLRVPVTPRNLVSLLVGLAGVAIITRADLRLSALAGRGDFYALIAAAMFACYLISGSFRRAPLIGYLGVMYSIAGAMLFGASIALRAPLLPARSIDWLWILLLVLIPTLVGHTLLNRAMHHFAAYVVNLSTIAEPVLTAIFAWFIFRAPVTPTLWLGGALVLAALVVEFGPAHSADRSSGEHSQQR